MVEARKKWIRSHIGISAVTLLCFWAFSYAALHFGVGHYFERLADVNAATAARMAKGQLDRQREQLIEVGRGWAFWDDMYDYVRSPNQAFVDLNLTDSPIEASGIDVFCVLNRRGEILVARALDPAVGLVGAPPDGLAGPRVEGGFATLIRAPATGEPVSGFVSTERGPLIAAAIPVMPTSATGDSPGVLIVARWLNEALAEDFSQQLGLDLRFVSTTAHGPEAGERPFGPEPGRYYTVSTHDSALVRVVLDDVLDNAVFSLVLALPREEARLAARTIWVVFLVLAICSLLGACAATYANLQNADRWLHAHTEAPRGGGFPLLAAAVGLGGVVLSHVLFFTVRSVEQERTEARFGEIASTVEQLLPQKLASLAGNLESLRHFYAASETITREEFRRFTSDIIASERGIHALAWIPRVQRHERSTYEQAAKEANLPVDDFSIQDIAGPFVPVVEKDEYFPAFYVEPLAGNERLVLFDCGSEPVYRAVLDRARDENKAFVTYIEDRSAVPGLPEVFLMFAPVYRDGRAGATTAARREALVGYVAGLFLTNEVIHTVLPASLRDDASVEIQALTTPKGTPAIRATDVQRVQSGPMAVRSFEFAGANWQVTSRATPAFIERNLGYNSWLVLLTSLTLTAFVAAGIAVRGRRLNLLREIIAGHDVPELSRAIRLRWRVQLPAMIALVTLAAAFVVWADVAGRAELRRQLDAAREDAEQVWRADVDDSGARLLDRMAKFTEVPGIREALLNGDRAALLAAARAQFEAARETDHLDSLSIMDASGTVIARLHAPEAFGDRPSRPMLDQARRTNMPIVTAESGTTVTLQLAGVYPWREGEEIFGYVIAGLPMVEMIERIEQKLSADLLLVVNRENVTRQAYDRENALGRVGTAWDNPSRHMVLSSRTREGLDELLKDFDALAPGDTRVFRHAPSSEANYYCEAVRIDAIDGSELGHLIVMLDASPIEASQRRTMGVLVLLCVLVGIPLALGLSIVTSNIEERLAITVAAREEAVARAKRLAVEAESASAAKSEFLANISHEIRTPLNGVLGVAGLLGETGLNEAQQKYLDIIRSSGDALLDVISDVLDFSKIEARRIDIQAIDFDPRAVIQQVAELLAVRAQEKGIELRVNIDPALPVALRGDPGRIRQVLTNLVSNAVKFTEQGHVELRAYSRPGEGESVHVCIAVEDTGIGIPAAKVSTLFTPFTQIDNSATRVYSGTGLGLAISRQLAELMGGTITLRSEEGRGSTFTFEVSLKRADLRPTEAPTAASRLNVLLVEDNEVNQMVALAMLRRLGHAVETAANGREALQRLRATDFDLVIMDCQMPEMDGFEATLAIRQDAVAGATHRNVPIIAMTAAAADVDRQRCLAAGMNGYVAKPVTQHALAEAIAACRPTVAT